MSLRALRDDDEYPLYCKQSEAIPRILSPIAGIASSFLLAMTEFFLGIASSFLLAMTEFFLGLLRCSSPKEFV
ncbi:MAG: hypothetical protein GWO87_01610 [Xanthomonadaceae bacterium]|nr:hypothetical protein [Rhodospirillaceae bacterium]NIA17868.1 hypothetical protein [Xanthomonadaceae bacterium]